MKIPHLRWWIAGLLFFSTVINYVDRQTLSVLAPVLGRALRLDLVDADQDVDVVARHAARAAVGQDAQHRQLVAQGQHLVDLLLVLGDDGDHVGVVQHVDQLAGDRVLVDRHRGAAQRHRRHLGPVDARPVVAGDAQLVAGPEAHRLQAEREVAHLLRVVGPVVGLPDAEVLLAHRRPVGPDPGILQHQGRKRFSVRHDDCPSRQCAVPR